MVLLFSVVSTIIILGWVLWFCQYGLDLTDESFYLVWIANPFNYSVSVTQFGFIYHPLYELVGGKVAALRQVNSLLTWGLSWMLVYVFMTTIDENTPLKARLTASAAFSTAGLATLIFAGTWLPTPSYNSLAFQSLLLCAIGMLLIGRERSWAISVGWILIGVGGWLAFMAKPTASVALALWTLCYLIAAGTLRATWLAVSVATATALLILSALVIDGSIMGFVDRLMGGVEMAGKLGANYRVVDIVRLEPFPVDKAAFQLILIYAAVFTLAAWLSHAYRPFLLLLGNGMSATLGLASIAVALELWSPPIYAGQFQALAFGAVALAGLATGVLLQRLRAVTGLPRKHWALALMLLTLPYPYAFGTGDVYWILIGAAGLFPVLAGAVFLSSTKGPRLTFSLISLGLATQLITAILIQSGLQTPYRQPQPLRENDLSVEIGRPGSVLVLSQGFGRYFQEMIGSAKKSGFERTTPMIDLSGASPGVLYAIDANAIGQAWTIGGYPGSASLATAALRRVSCSQLAAAWLLYDPDNPRSIPPTVLASFGAEFTRDFKSAGAFKTAPGAGGQPLIRTQQFFKPIRPIDGAVTACEASRVAAP